MKQSKKNELAIVAGELTASLISTILATKISGYPTAVLIDLRKQPAVTIIQDCTGNKGVRETPLQQGGQGLLGETRSEQERQNNTSDQRSQTERNKQGYDWPDTGESGETYDIEQASRES